MDLPNIIYGTAWKKERTLDLTQQAVQAGFRAIDTACQPKHYNEALIGQALALLYKEGYKRQELFLQTKFTPIGGQDPNAIPYDPKSTLFVQVLQSFEVSKKNLQTEYIDSYLLHSALFPFADLMQVWQAMQSIYKRQEIRHLGISNCYDLKVLQKLYETSEIKPSFVQNRFYSDTDYDKELRLWCDTKDIRYQSFWSLTANPHILASKTILTLSKKYNKSEAQILFNFLFTQGITPLSGTTSTLHMQDDLLAFDFELSLTEQEAIKELL